MLPDFEMGLRGVAAPERAFYFVFRGNDLLCAADRRLPDPVTPRDWRGSPLGNLPAFYFGRYLDLPCYTVQHEGDAALPEGMEWTGLRRLLVDENAALYSLAGRGRQILEFNLTHRYCGKCGQPTVAHERDLARQCEGCGHVVYPRVPPGMMVLVTRGADLPV